MLPEEAEPSLAELRLSLLESHLYSSRHPPNVQNSFKEFPRALSGEMAAVLPDASVVLGTWRRIHSKPCSVVNAVATRAAATKALESEVGANCWCDV